MENKTKNIYQKLLKIQQQIKGLSKDKDSHQYKYVTGNKILSFIKPLMDSEGLILKQEILSIDNERQDYKTKYGEKSEILSKVMMRFTWIDCDTGEKDENLFGANGQNDWEKGLGSALTYGERYFLLKYFHIATDEDDIDNPDRKPEDKEPTKVVNHSVTELPYLNVGDVNWIKGLKEKASLAALQKHFRINAANQTLYTKSLNT
jgi:hypothetical protein